MEMISGATGLRGTGKTWMLWLSPVCVCVAVMSVESREAHLSSLVVEAERRAADLATQAQRDGLSLEACHKDKQLRAWEWRSKLYKRMRTGFQHARESPWLHRVSARACSRGPKWILQTFLDQLTCVHSSDATKIIPQKKKDKIVR